MRSFMMPVKGDPGRHVRMIFDIEREYREYYGRNLVVEKCDIEPDVEHVWVRDVGRGFFKLKYYPVPAEWPPTAEDW